MATSPLEPPALQTGYAFYRRVVALDAMAHRKLRFAPDEATYAFAQNTTAMVLGAAEFAPVALEYPIVFVQDADKLMHPVALLGVRTGENLYVDAHGCWQARYVPAFARCYPFLLVGNGTDADLVACVDETCLALNVDRGELLINANGELEPRMRDMMQFLTNLRQELARTAQLMAQLRALNLLVPHDARLSTAGGDAFELSEFFLIDEARLAQLPDASIAALFRSGALALALLHLASVGNLARLVERVTQRSHGATPADTDRDKAVPQG